MTGGAETPAASTAATGVAVPVATAGGASFRVRVAADRAQGARWAADAIVGACRGAATAGRGPVLGLATGRTVEPIYAELATRARDGALDVTSLRSFNLDEYRGLPPGHPGSFRAFLARHLLDPAGIPAASARFPDADAPDPGAAAARYERAIRDAGGLDLQLLGIGVNGHVGFNEPGSGRESRTRVVRLTGSTRERNGEAFEGGLAPAEALTVGIATILEARRILLVAWGDDKAEALGLAVRGPVDPAVPASFLQEHPGPVDLVVDAAAARDLDLDRERERPAGGDEARLRPDPSLH